jgi:hypothetical protein
MGTFPGVEIDKTIQKKLPISMTLSNLKVLVQKLFKLETQEFQLMYKLMKVLTLPFLSFNRTILSLIFCLMILKDYRTLESERTPSSS